MEGKKTGENIKRDIVKFLVTKFGFDALYLNKIVWVTDQGANTVNTLRAHNRIDCMDHVINTVLHHGLDNDTLTKDDPNIAKTVNAPEAR